MSEMEKVSLRSVQVKAIIDFSIFIYVDMGFRNLGEVCLAQKHRIRQIWKKKKKSDDVNEAINKSRAIYCFSYLLCYINKIEVETSFTETFRNIGLDFPYSLAEFLYYLFQLY